MNFLETLNQGGFPLALNDLRFLQSALRDGIKGTASFMAKPGEPIIISGLVGTVSGSDITYTAGFIFANGEIYYVPGATISNVGSKYIDIETRYPTEGQLVFENLTSFYVYEQREGVLTNTAGAHTIDLVDFLNFADVIASYGFAKSLLSTWQTPGLINSWTNEGGIYGSARYRKTVAGDIELSGAVSNASVAAMPSTVFVLPVGYRPAANIRRTVMGKRNSTDYLPLQVIVFTNGNVNVYGYSTSETVSFSLDGIVFPTT